MHKGWSLCQHLSAIPRIVTALSQNREANLFLELLTAQKPTGKELIKDPKRPAFMLEKSMGLWGCFVQLPLKSVFLDHRRQTGTSTAPHCWKAKRGNTWVRSSAMISNWAVVVTVRVTRKHLASVSVLLNWQLVFIVVARLRRRCARCNAVKEVF